MKYLFVVFSNWLDRLFAYPAPACECTAATCVHTKVKEAPLLASKSTAQLRAMTKSELREYALKHKMDISLRHSKMEMISRIIARIG